MKKALITALAFASAALIYGGAQVSSVNVSANEIATTNQVTFSETKLNVSQTGDKLLVVTAINNAENISYVSEIGYTINGYTVTEEDFAPTTTYYETITLGVNGKAKTAQELGFSEANEESKLLIWEIAYDATFDYEITAYAIHEGDETNVAMGDTKTNRVTITFEIAGEVVGTQEVNYGGVAEELGVPGYDVVWDFDFNTEIESNTTVTGTKTEKTIRFTENSTTYTGASSADAPVFDQNGRYKVKLETSGSDNHSLTLNWFFDLTVEDIEAFEEMGYTSLQFDFAINCIGGGNASGKTLFFLNGTKGVYVEKQDTWIPVVVTLEQLSAYIQNGNGNFFSNTWLQYWPTVEFKDMKLSKLVTVTFMDGEKTVAVETIEKGSTVAPISVPGYDVVWDFDFNTSIMTNTTVTVSEKTEKTIRFRSDSTAYTGKSSAGAPVFGENGRYKVTLETSSSDKHSLTLNWFFDLTVEDIEAFEEMGYTTLEFDFNISLTGGQTSNGKTYSLLNGIKTITVADQNAWIHISVTLDELTKYVQSGNGKFFAHTYVHYWPTIEMKDMKLA